MPGYPHEWFVQTPALQEALCSICYDVLRDPVTLTCGHCYCRDCHGELHGNGINTCPTCRAPSTLLSRTPPIIASMVMTLATLCVNAASGCTEMPTLSERDRHITVCNSRIRRCPHCDWNVARFNLGDHLAQCPAGSHGLLVYYCCIDCRMLLSYDDTRAVFNFRHCCDKRDRVFAALAVDDTSADCPGYVAPWNLDMWSLPTSVTPLPSSPLSMFAVRSFQPTALPHGTTTVPPSQFWATQSTPLPPLPPLPLPPPPPSPSNNDNPHNQHEH